MTSSYEFRDAILQLFWISSQLNVKIILNEIFSQVALSFPLVMRPFHEATKHSELRDFAPENKSPSSKCRQTPKNMSLRN